MICARQALADLMCSDGTQFVPVAIVALNRKAAPASPWPLPGRVQSGGRDWTHRDSGQARWRRLPSPRRQWSHRLVRGGRPLTTLATWKCACGSESKDCLAKYNSNT